MPTFMEQHDSYRMHISESEIKLILYYFVYLHVFHFV